MEKNDTLCPADAMEPFKKAGHIDLNILWTKLSLGNITEDQKERVINHLKQCAGCKKGFENNKKIGSIIDMNNPDALKSLENSYLQNMIEHFAKGFNITIEISKKIGSL